MQPFAEKAGMAKIAEQYPRTETLNILKILKKLGFDGQLLGSEAYVKRRLEALTDSDILEMKEI